MSDIVWRKTVHVRVTFLTWNFLQNLLNTFLKHDFVLNNTGSRLFEMIIYWFFLKNVTFYFTKKLETRCK